MSGRVKQRAKSIQKRVDSYRDTTPAAPSPPKDLNNVLPKLAKRIHRDSNTTASTQNASSYGSNNSGGYSPPSQPSPPSMGPRNGSLGVQYTENPQRRRSSDFNSNGKSRSNTADSQSPPPPPPPYSPNPAPPMPPRSVSSTGINGSNRNSPLSNVFADVNNNNNDSYSPSSSSAANTPPQRPVRRQQRKSSITFKPMVELPPEVEQLRNRDIAPDIDSAAERALNIAASIAQLNSAAAAKEATGGTGGHQKRGSVYESENENKPKVEGREIQQDHAQYALTYGMMLGIRVCITQALVDMSYIRQVLTGKESKVQDLPHARPFDEIRPRNGPSSLEFRNVSFSYEAATLASLSPSTTTPQRVVSPCKVSPVSSSDPADEVKVTTTGNDVECDVNTVTTDNGSSGNGKEREIVVPPSPPEILQDISFSIKPGQNIALVGPSGSGKSSTLKLITRMLEPTSGEIYIDGVRVNDVTLKSLRERIAVVPQETSLFDDTIEFNLRYGQEEASEYDVQQAIIKSNLQSTIEKFPEGLMTRVGERGARLSGGERQKISIARAILRNPSLILCDEVTSSVDAFAERDIVETLGNAMNDRTTITVAHRLSSIVHCDQILVLSKGRIVESGTHKELLDRNGLYRKMWDCQHNVGTFDSSSYSNGLVERDVV